MILMCNVYVMAADTLVVVKGYVYDASNRLPLTNVNIVETNTLNGTSTDGNGLFRLRVPIKNFRLRVSHVAYKEKTISMASY